MTFGDLLDGDSFIILSKESFYCQSDTHYVFEKILPNTVYTNRKFSVLNARRLSDDCYTIIPDATIVLKVGVKCWHLAEFWDFEGAVKEQ